MTSIRLHEFAVRRALCTVSAVAVLLGLAASSALADTVVSSNWAGYAVHHAGVRFTKVIGTWKQPRARCSGASTSYSAVWLGLGGYSGASNALEQIGSEVDCNARGKAVSSAWYELVPAPSRPIQMRVNPGDTLSASVVVSGHTVVMVLRDMTRHRSFQRKLHASAIDTSSADWIVEAPSECINPNVCRTLPLANFGSATFTTAAAQAVGRRTGTISDRRWNATKIRLFPGASQFVDYGSTTAPAATPSALSRRGSSFRVTFALVPVSANPFASAAQAPVRGGYIVH